MRQRATASKSIGMQSVMLLSHLVLAGVALGLSGCQSAGGPAERVGRLSERKTRDELDSNRQQPVESPAEPNAADSENQLTADREHPQPSRWGRLFGRLSSGEPRRVPLPRTDAETVQTVSGDRGSAVLADEF